MESDAGKHDSSPSEQISELSEEGQESEEIISSESDYIEKNELPSIRLSLTLLSNPLVNLEQFNPMSDLDFRELKKIGETMVRKDYKNMKYFSFKPKIGR